MERDMSLLGAMVPTAMVAFATLLAVLPWGGPIDGYPVMRFLMPLAPYIVIHFWFVHRRSAMPPLVAFLAGLVIDVVTRGPLGLWPFVYLAGMLLAAFRLRAFDQTLSGQAVGFLITIVMLAAVQWALASGYYLRVMDPMPILQASMVAAVGYLMLLVTLTPFVNRRRGPDNPTLARGG
jgi:rod shape-determining protein MreD